MKTDMILHILRNPHGFTGEQIRKTAIAAADEIERWKGAMKNMQDWCDENGWDTTTRN